MKIDIEIEDTSLFTQVAPILDRQEVQDDITRLRKKLTGGKTYPSVAAWKKTGLNLTYQMDIVDMIVKHEISPVFAPVLEEAIITCRVTQFSRILMIPIPRKDLAELYFADYDIISSEDYEYALVTPMEATRQEVAKAYGDIKQSVKKDAKREEPEDLTDYFELVQPLSDTKSEIKTHREWYWQHLPKVHEGEGKSYYRIALDIASIKEKNHDMAKRDAMALEDKIRQAIKDYKKLIPNNSK